MEERSYSQFRRDRTLKTKWAHLSVVPNFSFFPEFCKFHKDIIGTQNSDNKAG